MDKMAELPLLARIITQETGLVEQKIYKLIYELYLQKKVDLQPGKPANGNPLVAEDGSKFYWFQYR